MRGVELLATVIRKSKLPAQIPFHSIMSPRQFLFMTSRGTAQLSCGHANTETNQPLAVFMPPKAVMHRNMTERFHSIHICCWCSYWNWSFRAWILPCSVLSTGKQANATSCTHWHSYMKLIAEHVLSFRTLTCLRLQKFAQHSTQHFTRTNNASLHGMSPFRPEFSMVHCVW